MRLRTRFELAGKTEKELSGLYQDIFNRVAGFQPNSMERMNALASLANIQRERASRKYRL